MPELDKQTYELSLPHLGAEGRERVMSRYLGQITWRGLCDAVGVDFGGLPDLWQHID